MGGKGKRNKDKSRKEKKSKTKDVIEESAPPARPPPTPGDLTSSQNISGDFSPAAVTKIEDEPGLLFTGELLNGRPVIKGGNIEKLVERLTFEKYNDTKYVKAFMLTFRSFTTPAELLQLLIDRFNISCPKGSSKTEEQSFETSVKKVVRLRVFNVLKDWLKNAFYDFRNDTALLGTLEKFINKEMAPTMENPANTLQSIIKKKLAGSDREYEHVFTGEPPAPEIPINVTPQNKNDIMTYSPVEIARQLTLIEYRLFAAIKPSECVSQHWMSKKKEELAPNILKMISRFNEVSNWVASEIVKCTDLDQRTKTLKFVIDIAENCDKLNNFNAVMEIISGLHSSSVFRLKQSWAGLPKKSVAAYEEMHAKMSRDKSYKLFREALRNVNPPCIPYLGMYLTDLTFIEEGNPDNLPDGSINFTKRQRLSEVIAEIQTYQNTPYFLRELTFVRDYLYNVEALPEEQCYKLSLKREGRRGTQAVDTDTPDLPFGDLEKKSSYVFDKPDSDSNIKFDKKQAEFETYPTISAGTNIKLIERLTYHEYQDMEFLWAFLMTYQTFSNAGELLDLLHNRFDMPKPANPSKQQKDKFMKTRLMPIHLRICNVVKCWISTYPSDFFDEELQSKVINITNEWAEMNSNIKAPIDQIKDTLEKKLSEPLPTPECRFIGFLADTEESEELQSFYKGKGVLDFTEELIAEQLTLIEQNFFSSILPRECLCETWEFDEMSEKAPNLLAMKENYEQVRCWAITEVIEQEDLQKQYSILTSLVSVAEKLWGMKNFSTSMAITSGLQFLNEKFPEIWEWVPAVILSKFKELEGFLRVPKKIKLHEKGDGSVIPLIDTYINQLNGITNLLTEKNGNLINFERRRKQYDVYKTFKIYQGRPYTYDYDGACGGYLYHSKILSPNAIEEKLKTIERPNPPDCRPELIDITKNYTTNDGTVGGDNNSGDIEGEKEDRDEAAYEQIKNYLIDILNDEPDLLSGLINDARSSLASELMGELENFTESSRNELAVMHSELGLADNALEASGNILGRVFKDATISEWEAEDETGYVMGWSDIVGLHVVENTSGKYLVKVKTHLDKSYASIAIRLFEFFSNSDQGPFKNAIIASTVTEDVRQIMKNAKISVFNFVGTQIC